MSPSMNMSGTFQLPIRPRPRRAVSMPDLTALLTESMNGLRLTDAAVDSSVAPSDSLDVDSRVATTDHIPALHDSLSPDELMVPDLVEDTESPVNHPLSQGVIDTLHDLAATHALDEYDTTEEVDFNVVFGINFADSGANSDPPSESEYDADEEMDDHVNDQLAEMLDDLYSNYLPPVMPAFQPSLGSVIDSTGTTTWSYPTTSAHVNLQPIFVKLPHSDRSHINKRAHWEFLHDFDEDSSDEAILLRRTDRAIKKPRRRL